ncbi:galanin receptor 2a-like [Patiria miniata]|uniref:G-protein coupled receptors family 1 profile domain-containing protein n=1 Tax=Patiria miniata TaxID=46514 RepID=A0A914BMI0_PATMI|nr:galanin receptor 2a-like [Patiria miniata]
MAEQAALAFQAVVGIVGICGNGLVCGVIAKVRFMHTLTNAFIFNQALVDLIGSLVILLQRFVPIPDPIPPGAIGVLLCALWATKFLQWGPFTVSTFNLIALTLERYLAIVFPFRYQTLASRKKATAVLVGMWVAGFLFSVYSIYFRYYEDGECVPNQVAHPRVIGVCVFFVKFFLPVSVMLVVYGHIMVVLKKGTGRIQPGPAAAGPSTEGQGESLMRARRNTFKTLLIVCVAFIICWSPDQIFFFLFNIGVEVDFNSPVSYLFVGMVSLNCCLNPFIYAIKYKQFQKALKVVFGKRGDRASVATLSTGQN